MPREQQDEHCRERWRDAFARTKPTKASPKNPTPDVSCKYGAPLGRPGGHPGNLADEPGKFYLVRCPLDSGGYDRGGAYWGLGAPLYYFESPTGEGGYVRGRTREIAKSEVRKIALKAEFYR